jgi:ComF family protein
MHRPARAALRGLFNLVFPDQCRICSAPLEDISRIPVCQKCLAAPQSIDAEYWCDRCRAPFLTPWFLVNGFCDICRDDESANTVKGFDTAYSFGPYEGELRRLIQLYKYDRIHTLSAPLGRLLIAGLPTHERFDWIVAVPMHWRRRWQRGFNQAELLARVVSRHSGVPLVPALERKQSTAAQAGLSDAQRRTNTDHAFAAAAKHRAALAGKHVLLIDDVLTTGATLSAASRVLRRSGARRITVLTVARADRRSPWSLLTQTGSSDSKIE